MKTIDAYVSETCFQQTHNINISISSCPIAHKCLRTNCFFYKRDVLGHAAFAVFKDGKVDLTINYATKNCHVPQWVSYLGTNCLTFTCKDFVCEEDKTKKG